MKISIVQRVRSITISQIFLAITLVVAAFLRIYKISDYMTFLGDEGRDVLVAYGILHGHFTLLGPTASVGGFFLGPIYYYFMTPFLFLFNYDPVGPAVMVALFGVVTVWLVYKIGKEFLGETAGLFACMFYAISPLVIAYSRSSWNPNLMPFFSLLIIYFLYHAVRKNSIRLFLLVGIFYGIAMQLHYIELFLGVAMILYIALKKIILPKKKDVAEIIKSYLFVFFGFLIGFSPFLAFEARHGFPNIQSIVSFVFQSKDTGVGGNFLFTIQYVFFTLFSRLVTNFPPPEQITTQTHPHIAIWFDATLLLSLASVFLFIFQYFQLRRHIEAFSKRSILLLWFCAGVLLFGFYKKSIYDYYFEFMFPLPFLFVGNFLSYFYETFKPLPKIAGKVLVIVVFCLLVWINLSGVPFRYTPNKQKDQVKRISDFVLSKTDGKPFNFALITKGNSDHAYRYFFTIENRAPITIEGLANDPSRKTVTNQLLIVCEDQSCSPLGYSLWEVAGFGRAEIVGQWDLGVVKVFKLDHYKGP